MLVSCDMYIHIACLIIVHACYIGLFQMGTGTLLPSPYGPQCSLPGRKQKNTNAVHFRDRHVGATYFEVRPTFRQLGK
jgi:hypothetical protein